MESEQFLDAVADRLGRRFPQLAGEELRHIVAMAYEPLIDARVRLYLPLLVERRAINALAAPARANDQGDRGNGAGGRDPGPDVTVEITSGGMCADPFPNPDLGAMSEVA